MTQWLIIDLIVFLTVAMLSGFVIPQILLIAFRKNLFDEVDPRKVHRGAVPRLGGIAFFPTILFALLLVFGVFRQYAPGIQSEMIESSITALCFITCGIIILYLVGMADDLIGLKYRAKFIAQIVCAAIIVAGGIYLDNLHGFLGLNLLPFGISIALTILLTVFITNAINLIDGIDGLASGLSAIACAFYGYIFFNAGMHIYGMVAFATLGALVPFFYYNVFGNVTKHKKIFMGDTGALTIGFILSVLSIRVCMIDVLSFSSDIANTLLSGANPAVVAFAPLLIPCFDVVRVYLRRIKAHRNPFMPDKTHIHHKLLALGMPQRRALITILASSIILIIINYFLASHVHIIVLFFSDLAVWIGLNKILTRAILAREEKLGLILYE